MKWISNLFGRRSEYQVYHMNAMLDCSMRNQPCHIKLMVSVITYYDCDGIKWCIHTLSDNTNTYFELFEVSSLLDINMSKYKGECIVESSSSKEFLPFDILKDIVDSIKSIEPTHFASYRDEISMLYMVAAKNRDDINKAVVSITGKRKPDNEI